MNRMRILAVLTLLVVFVAGGLVGAAVVQGRGGDGPRERPPRGNDRRGGPPPMFAEGSPVAERLKLTPVQRDSIEKLTTRDRDRADSVFREVRQRMRGRFDSTMTAVEAVLTPEQRAEWQKIRQEWQARERDGRGRRGGRGGRDRGPFPDGPPPPPADSAAR